MPLIKKLVLSEHTWLGVSTSGPFFHPKFLNMSLLEQFAVIDCLALATWLRKEEWEEDWESTLPFQELYEKIDESGEWYLRPEYQAIYDSILQEYLDTILDFETQKQAAIIHPN